MPMATAVSVGCEGCGQESSEEEIGRCRSCGDGVCESCDILCSACDERLCNSCSFGCDGCCDSHCRDCLSSCDDCGDYRCDDCGPCSCGDDDDNGSSSDSRVHRWDYRPSKFRPKGNYPTEALLGVELEVGGYADHIADAVTAVDSCGHHLYMKEDGSISGVEIVTHPMTLAWAREYPFSGLLDSLRASGCWVNSGYGLHIHVSRNAFRRYGKQSPSLQMRWLLFLYRNLASVEKLARREQCHWAKFTPPVPGELAHKARGPQVGDRYVAVNCNNVKTFELRFFASTLDTAEFWSSVEFADASVRYAAAVQTRDIVRGKALTWRHFTEWVTGQDYPHLSAAISR